MKINQQKTDLAANEYLVCQTLSPELEELENDLNFLNLEKTEYERQINLFNSEYIYKLGDLISEILKIRVVIFDESSDPEYQKAKLAYEDFDKIRHQQLQNISYPLTDVEKKELKSAYRKASRLCHPDKLADDKKLEGEIFFKSLNEAYRKQDLNLVKGILLQLEDKFRSLITSIEHIDDKAILKQKINSLREHITILKAEIKYLKESEVYQRIQTISDMDEYFEGLEKELKTELKCLKFKRKKLLKNS
jgi:cell division protein FtsB